jgi:hypothetical protein
VVVFLRDSRPQTGIWSAFTKVWVCRVAPRVLTMALSSQKSPGALPWTRVSNTRWAPSPFPALNRLISSLKRFGEAERTAGSASCRAVADAARMTSGIAALGRLRAGSSAASRRKFCSTSCPRSEWIDWSAREGKESGRRPVPSDSRHSQNAPRGGTGRPTAASTRARGP